MKRQVILILGFAFVFSVALLIFTPSLASADIDWTRGQSSIRIDDDGDVCNESREKVVSWPEGEIRESNVCVVYGKDFDMAYTYATQAGGSNAPLMRPHNSDSFSPLLGVTDARLKPGTNTVIYGVKGAPNPLVSVDNFMNVVNPERPSSDDVNSPPSGFKVNTTLFDDKFLSSALTATGDKVVSYEVSGDGRYVIAYFKNTGIVKYDTTNRQVIKIVSASSLTSWSSINQPRIEAVSDDGRFVFVAPSGQLIDTENCGDVSPTPFDFHTQILHVCRIRENADIIHSLVTQAAEIQGAQFSEDGNTLKFFTVDSTSGDRITHRIVMGATDVKIIKYLALGDSYSSGEGDVSYSSGQTNYLPGTESKDNCHISYRSYPFLLRDKWNIPSGEMRSIACSGARVKPDYYGIGEYLGQHSDLKSKNSTEKLDIRSDSLNNFSPSILRQIDFVAKYQPDIVTFTGGGNDVGFGEVIAYCADPRKSKVSCPQVSDPQISANLRRAIDDVRGSLTEFIQQVKEISPASKIYLIGYPQFVALDGCNDGSVLLNKPERLMIRSSVTRLNNILKLVARDTDVYYVDIEDSLEGGQICDGSLYMTGPIKVLGKAVLGDAQEAYHPNANGHKKIATAIDERIKNDNLSYTIINIPPEESGQRVIRMAVTKDYAGVGSEQTVTMGPGIFHEDGTVDIVGFSNRISLGSAKTEHDGSLNIKIKIPPEMEPGYHLLTLTGKSVEGDMVQIQQYITVYNQASEVSATLQARSILPFTNSKDVSQHDSLLSSKDSMLPGVYRETQPSLSWAAVNDEKLDKTSMVKKNTYITWGVIALVVGIIVKGALYVTKKER